VTLVMMRPDADPGAATRTRSDPMKFRKAILAGAAVVAAGLMGLTSAASAGTASINYVQVDGNTSGVHPIAGDFVSGTATFGGGTYGCVGGTVEGDAHAGPVPTGGQIDFTVLDIVCATPIGIDATISIDQNCATFVPDATATVADGKTDTAVPGTVTLGTGCGNVTAATCSADVQGTVGATYNEVTQELILNGNGFTLSNQSVGCFGLISGNVGLNAITFGIDASAGGLDFRTTP
jgi:hypothetical protein